MSTVRDVAAHDLSAIAAIVIHEIELRVLRAEILLALGQSPDALRQAESALELAEQDSCEYAWGQADALHAMGLARLELGESELARLALERALQRREWLMHPEAQKTRELLNTL